MHEISLIANLLKKIDAIAAAQNAEKILAVKVRIGALAHISAGHFRQHFVQGTRGSTADGARLEVETCGDLDDPHAQEILLESVEVEVRDD